MRLLFVADGRSPIALNWIAHFVDEGHEVHLASTYPAAPELDLASLHFVPLAFSRAARGGTGRTSDSPLHGRSTAALRTWFRQWFGPLTLGAAAGHLSALYKQIQPDLVHAMRIPFEGMAASLADPSAPLLVSIWGNDLTLHAKATPLMAYHTRRALRRANALHTDTRRDIRLGIEWGFPAERPSIVLPGAGGIQLDLFAPPPEFPILPVVINPRGFRAYVCNEAFFRSIPLVLQLRPDARFVCPAMQGQRQAERWVSQLGIAHAVELLPMQSRSQMADLFRRAQVAVSPTTHDGTPNTLLEAMACGCFPVAGELESLREWIRPGQNGLLVDPTSPEAQAEAILKALDDAELRSRAAVENAQLVAERTEYGAVMAEAKRFYREIITQ